MAKLKPRARLIRTIGDKLISGPEAAIIELVKNSYDADSPSVDIKITPPSKHFNGQITVTDFGHGMSEEDFLHYWLEPAADNKVKNKKSPLGRIVLGAKGVGRFASASLGSLFSIISTYKNENECIETNLNLDWHVFESYKYLDDIDIDISSKKKSLSNHSGTIITITELTSIWDEKKILDLIKELRRLATPTSSQFNISLDLSSYTCSLDFPYNFDGVALLEKNNQLASILNESSALDDNLPNVIHPYSLINHSDYHLKGSFDKTGLFEGTFNLVRADNVPKPITFKVPFTESGEVSCGRLNLDIRIYDQEPDSLKALFQRMGLDFNTFGVRKARKLISESSGIAIYRAGFRVRPYGEPDHDWLKLEKRRVQQPSLRIGHAQVAGTIHIEDEGNSNLIERSSREGLETNESYHRLTSLLVQLFLKIEPKRKEYRERAGLSRKPKISIGDAREIASLDSISDAVQKLSPEEQKPILLKIESESQALTKALDEIEAYQKLLESHAALGLVVGQVIHDGRTYLEPINSSAESISKNAKYLFEDSKKGALVREYYPSYGEAIQTAANGLGSLFQSLDPISGRKNRKVSKFSPKDVVENVINLLEEKLIDNSIEIINQSKTEKVYGYSGDMQSALLNIIDNAIYWLSTDTYLKKEICIFSSIEDENIFTHIKNNGPVIDDDMKLKIFDAGVSHKQDGHGLGLSIAREACRNSKGDLKLTELSPETIFTIQFPRISKDEK